MQRYKCMQHVTTGVGREVEQEDAWSEIPDMVVWM